MPVSAYFRDAGGFRQSVGFAHPEISFSAGELQPRITGFPGEPGDCLTVRLDFRDPGDMMRLHLTVDAVRRHPALSRMGLRALIPYFPCGRQDRVCYPGEPLSAKAFADFINWLRFDEVEVWDPHSAVTAAVLDRAKIIPASFWAKSAYLRNWDFVVAPDKGAHGRASEFAGAYFGGGAPAISRLVQADKVRNPDNGEILGMKLDYHARDFEGKNVLMVDDISDGGRTFQELAKLLRKCNAGRVGLFVTHLIGAGGFKKFRDQELGKIDAIYSPNVFPEMFDRELVTPLPAP